MHLGTQNKMDIHTKTHIVTISPSLFGLSFYNEVCQYFENKHLGWYLWWGYNLGSLVISNTTLLQSKFHSYFLHIPNFTLIFFAISRCSGSLFLTTTFLNRFVIESSMYKNQLKRYNIRKKTDLYTYNFREKSFKH